MAIKKKVNTKKRTTTASKTLTYYLNLPWTYTIQTARDNNNKKIYVLRVNELPNLCTDARSLDTAMKQIKEVMLAAFELYQEAGDPIPEPKNSRILSVPPHSLKIVTTHTSTRNR